MYLDFKELLAILNANNVRYLVVGGYAVSFHAQPRATKDLDLWVNPDLANANALYGALAEFGAPLANLTPADFAEATGRAQDLADVVAIRAAQGAAEQSRVTKPRRLPKKPRPKL